MARKQNNIDTEWFVRNGFFSREAFIAKTSECLKVALVGMFIAVAANLAPQLLHPDYLEKAMAQGIGPELWQVAGMPGLVGLGLFFLFPTRRLFASSAIVLLEVSYSVGNLMTGVFAGWLLVEAPHEVARHGVLLTLLVGVAAIIALATCALMNFFVWYLSWLVRGDVAFMN